jgi:copper ion binding protein
MESITLVAPDISCEHCQHAIEGTLSKLDGVSLAKVDIPRKTVQVDYDAQRLTRAQIEETLDDLGYTVAG